MTPITKRPLYQTPRNRDSSRATVKPSSPFHAVKMIIYVNPYLHNLYYSSYVTESHRRSLSDSIIIIPFALNLFTS